MLLDEKPVHVLNVYIDAEKNIHLSSTATREEPGLTQQSGFARVSCLLSEFKTNAEMQTGVFL